MSFTLCSSYAIIRKAGYGASSWAVASGALLSDYCDEAEGQVNILTGFDWVANYADIGANYKPALADVTSDIAAIKVIIYSANAYQRIVEQQTIMDALRDNADRCIKELQKADIRKKMGAS